MNLNRIALKVEAGLKENCPVFTGFLRNSIVVKPSKKGIIISMADYGEYVEYGFPAGTYVSPEKLKEWCRIKLGDENIAYALSKYFLKYGRKPNPFIREFLFNNLKRIIKEEK